MPGFWCDYCQLRLHHCSPFGRKEHNKGKKHIYNKIEYFKKFLEEFQREKEARHALMHPDPRMIGGMPPIRPPVGPPNGY